ncbi:MAG: hypothetical protein Q9220_002651 [cf. Caloplaca sp. 1 TL-2023]
MVARLEGIELPLEDIEMPSRNRTYEEDREVIDAGGGSTSTMRNHSAQPPRVRHLEPPEPNLGLDVELSVILATSRVYRRVQTRDVDAMTTVSTSRSHPWSILSGVSLAQISIVAVISLPLHEHELASNEKLLALEDYNGGHGYFDKDVTFEPESSSDSTTSRPRRFILYRSQYLPRPFPHHAVEYMENYSVRPRPNSTPDVLTLRRIKGEYRHLYRDELERPNRVIDLEIRGDLVKF